MDRKKMRDKYVHQITSKTRQHKALCASFRNHFGATLTSPADDVSLIRLTEIMAYTGLHECQAVS
jgi:hypothetical protein